MDVESSRSVAFAPDSRNFNGRSGRPRTYYRYSEPGRSGIRSNTVEFNFVPNSTYGGQPVTIPKANLWSTKNESNALREKLREMNPLNREFSIPVGPYKPEEQFNNSGGMLMQRVLTNPGTLDTMSPVDQVRMFSKLLANPNAYPFESIYTGPDSRLYIQYSPIPVFPTNPSNPYDKSQYSTLLNPHMPIVNAIRIGLQLPTKGGARRTRNKTKTRKSRRKTNRKYKRSPTKALTAGAHK